MVSTFHRFREFGWHRIWTFFEWRQGSLCDGHGIGINIFLNSSVAHYRTITMIIIIAKIIMKRWKTWEISEIHSLWLIQGKWLKADWIPCIGWRTDGRSFCMTSSVTDVIGDVHHSHSTMTVAKSHQTFGPPHMGKEMESSDWLSCFPRSFILLQESRILKTILNFLNSVSLSLWKNWRMLNRKESKTSKTKNKSRRESKFGVTSFQLLTERNCPCSIVFTLSSDWPCRPFPSFYT